MIHSRTMKGFICRVYELEGWHITAFVTDDLSNYPFKVMMIKQNACPGGHSNLSSFRHVGCVLESHCKAWFQHCLTEIHKH